MSWFKNLFTPSKNTRNSRTAISSTHEAFSLPTSSPRHPNDAFHPGSPSTPDPMTAASPSTYSYPPQSPTGAYDYVPAATGSRSRKSTVLPLNTPGSPMGAPFPPLSTTWNRLRAWLSNEYPELGDTLNYGILPQDLAQIEMSFGFALPQAIRDSYLCADGQEAESAAGCSEGLFFGLTLLPLEDVLEEYRFWREVDDDPNTGANARLRDLMDSIPPDWVKREYSSRGWIPLVADKAGNYLGVDVNPGEAGTVGQVIVFGRDFDTKVVMWRGDGTHGWAKWLSGFVDDLEAGEGYELGLSNDASEGSEDSVGYESYFYDGIGRGQGDGGGDTGTGGMRLSGEYRGWSVLEAWADRSVRKWQQMGVIPEPQVTPTKGKNVEQLPIETLKAVSNVTSSAEVPIPVLPGSSSSGVPKHDSISSRQPIPTISVTKPPVPMPVDLPTHDDIIVELETANAPPSHTDLESGSNVMMREIEQALPAARTPTSSSQEKSNSVASSKLPPPPSPLPSPSRTVATPPAPVPLSAQTPDLLVDSTTTLAATIPPLTTTSEPSSSVHSEDSPVLISNEDAIPPSVGTPSALGEETLSNDGVLVSDPEADSADDSPSSPKAKKRKSEESKRADSVGSSKEVA